MTVAAQLQITVRDTRHSTVLESTIRRKLASLEKLQPRITAFHVTLEALNHHHRKGGQFCVKLHVKVPGAEILITRDHDRDIYIALRDACQAARRQLIEHAERGQGSDGAVRSRCQRVTNAGVPELE